jgi:hypothetical protein
MPLGFRNWFSSRRRMRSDDSINETFHTHGQHVHQRDALTADDRLTSIREVDEAIENAMRTPRRPHPFGGITVTTTTTVQRFDAVSYPSTSRRPPFFCHLSFYLIFLFSFYCRRPIY